VTFEAARSARKDDARSRFQVLRDSGCRAVRLEVPSTASGGGWLGPSLGAAAASSLSDPQRASPILLIIGTSLRVIPVDMLVPSWRAGDELVWQVNPELVDQHYYGRHVCATAADGLAQLKPLLLQLMAS
jgi:hypothetical protein